MNNVAMESDISRFYCDKTVLLTGGTGFIGKVLVEKLLRCTRVSTVFLLVRSKRGKTAQQRIADMFNNELFAKLKTERADFMKSVQTVEGDVSLPDLGLSSADSQLLQASVHVVFHVAATVSFDESLQKAIHTNVRGTKTMFQLVRQFQNLKAFVHVSTAFANCTESEVYDDFFEPPLSGENAIKLSECLSSQQLDSISQSLCGQFPNTYTFTKAVGENVVKVHGQGLPVVIFRPSIVVPTAEEPVKGWTDNLYGPTGVQCGVGAGLFHAMLVNEEFVADLVPVDMAVNALLACAWDIAQNRDEDNSKTLVYNFVSSCQNKALWRDFSTLSLKWGRRYPVNKAVWYYAMYSSKYYLVYMFYHWMLHLLPALLVDSVLFVTGQEPRMWKTYGKISKFSKVIAYFCMRQWVFHNPRTMKLWQKMSGKDRELFNFEISTLDWDEFFKNNVLGLRNFFFKESIDTLPAARRKQMCFLVLHTLLQILLAAAAAWLVWTAFSLSKFTFTKLSSIGLVAC